MDRILRPTGFIIVRDKTTVIEFIKKYLHALHWEAITVVGAEPSSESNERDDPHNPEETVVIRSRHTIFHVMVSIESLVRFRHLQLRSQKSKAWLLPLIYETSAPEIEFGS
jgi:hypothetical protein